MTYILVFSQILKDIKPSKINIKILLKDGLLLKKSYFAKKTILSFLRSYFI